jgi:hypothetical protein
MGQSTVVEVDDQMIWVYDVSRAILFAEVVGVAEVVILGPTATLRKGSSSLGRWPRPA